MKSPIIPVELKSAMVQCLDGRAAGCFAHCLYDLNSRPYVQIYLVTEDGQSFQACLSSEGAEILGEVIKHNGRAIRDTETAFFVYEREDEED